MTETAIDEITAIVRAAGASGEFILKRRVAALESSLSEQVGAGVVAVGSPAGGLALALLAAGLSPGEAVVLPATAAPACAAAVRAVRAVPVAGAVDPATAALTAAALPQDDRVAAVLACSHWAERVPAAVTSACVERGVPLVEHDTAFSWDLAAGRPSGRFAVLDAGPGSTFGGIGLGAFVVAPDEADARRLRSLRNHGQDLGVRFLYHEVGFNCRMDEIGAAWLDRRLSEAAANQRRAEAHLTRCRAVVDDGDAVLRPGGVVLRPADRERALARLRGSGLAAAPLAGSIAVAAPFPDVLTTLRETPGG